MSARLIIPKTIIVLATLLLALLAVRVVKTHRAYAPSTCRRRRNPQRKPVSPAIDRQICTWTFHQALNSR